MGGLVDSIFGGGGGKAAKSAIKFQKGVFNWAKDQSSPFISGGSGAFGALGGILGLGGTAEQDAAFKNYMNSTGYKFLLDSGAKAVTGSMAAKGLLKSGSTLKALTSFGQNLASTKTAEYMNSLLGMSQVGTNALAATTGAGVQTGANIAQTGAAGAASKADAWGSLFNLGLAVAGMSDPRLKGPMEKIGELASGLSLYVYHFLAGGPLQWGVNADEVAEKLPEALGPVIGGYRSVNYALVR